MAPRWICELGLRHICLGGQTLTPDTPLNGRTSGHNRSQLRGVVVPMIAAIAQISLAGCSSDRTSTAGVPSAVRGARIGVAPSGDLGEWAMPAKDYAGSRYSALEDITAGNVSHMTVAWTFSTGVLKGHEGAPLVIGPTMYIVTPYPNVAYAFDLSRPGAPLRWKFRPENAQSAKAEACCDVVNRGAAYADSTVFYNLLDGHTVAVDVRTGAERWRTRVADPSHGETMTMAPLVVHGKVLVGPSGGEMGVRGWIAALDARTGKERWRAYNLGPDSRRQDRPQVRAVLRGRARHRPGVGQLAERHVAARWRGDLGMADLRSGAQSRVLRHEQPGTVGRRAAAR